MRTFRNFVSELKETAICIIMSLCDTPSAHVIWLGSYWNSNDMQPKLYREQNKDKHKHRHRLELSEVYC